MKALATLLLALFACSCAQMEGNAIAGTYKATFVMTDFKAYQQGPDLATMAGVKQTTVPVQALKTGQNIAAAAYAFKGIEALSNNSTAEVLGEQATTRSIHAGEQATKQLQITEGTLKEGLKLQPPIVLPRP